MYIRVPKELHARVKQKADDSGVSMNTFVIDALEERLSLKQVPLFATIDKEGAHYILRLPPEMFLEQENDSNQLQGSSGLAEG